MESWGYALRYTRRRMVEKRTGTLRGRLTCDGTSSASSTTDSMLTRPSDLVLSKKRFKPEVVKAARHAPCFSTTAWSTTMVQDRLTIPPTTGSRSTSSSPLSSETPMVCTLTPPSSTRPLLDDVQTTYPTQYPTAVAEVAIAAQLERLRVTEALAACDNVVVLLQDAYTSVRQKSAIIFRLERELEILRHSSTPSSINFKIFSVTILALVPKAGRTTRRASILKDM
ncbi:hypothetical protein EDD15DRAFT_1025195 [Pisolithus albus]|nr:hypothetical protein EDD15DRAFT_1025195 [Pisolithus albus]